METYDAIVVGGGPSDGSEKRVELVNLKIVIQLKG